MLTRFLRVADPQGRTTRVTQRRFVSMADPHLAGLETTLVPEDWSGRLEVRSAIDGRVNNAGVLARSDRPRSWRFFTEALASDLYHVQGGTTAEGIHLGAMAGTVDLVQRCYTGLQSREGMLRLKPSLPEELDGLDFDIRYRGHWGINLHLTPRRLRVRVAADGAEPVPVAVRDQVVELAPGSAQEFRL